MRRPNAVLFAPLAIFLSLTADADAAQKISSLPRELAWVGLFNRELIQWLENENRLAELCSPAEGPERWADCKEAHLEPKVQVIFVRAQPRDDAPLLGTISIVALPGRGLRAFASAQGTATPFTPDLFDVDWGYGPYFHQTILERRGSWYRVPIESLPPGWIDAATWTDSVDVQTVHAGDIIRTARGDVTVLAVGKGELRVRPEQDADMWCGTGKAPPLTRWDEVRIPFRELLDRRGHLLITKKYTRGC
jgi:hypothetical protein